MVSGRLTRLRGETSIPVIQSTGTPPKANPFDQSSSSAEAQPIGILASTTGNYIEYT